MRSDGSFKSLTTGVGTVPISQQGGREYMQQCSNMRNDQIAGLTRRAGAKLVADSMTSTSINFDLPYTHLINDFNPQTDVLKPFSLGEDDYWFYSRSAPADQEGYLVAVFDSEGVAVNTYSNPSQYMTQTSGNDDVRMTVSGERVYVVNTNTTVEMVEGSNPISENHSMIACKFAPIVYSTIIVGWAYQDGTLGEITYEVGEDHPVQPIPDIADVDTGVNTMAYQIGAKIVAQVEADGKTDTLNIMRKRSASTIGFERFDTGVFGNTYTPLSDVTLSDGSGGAFEVYNGTVRAVNDLPRFAVPSSIIEVAPDPESGAGVYYMQAVASDSETAPEEQPVPRFDFSSESTDEQVHRAQRVSGYWHNYVNGVEHGQVHTGTNPFPVDYPNEVMWECSAATDNPQTETSSTTITFRTRGIAGDVQPDPTSVRWIELWRRETENPDANVGPFEYTKEVAVPVFQTGFIADTGTSQTETTWTGTIDTGYAMEPNARYYGYYRDVLSVHLRIAEVQWYERSHPEQDTLINADTFPHVLYRLDNGEFEFGNVNQVTTPAASKMQLRAAGDDDTNPRPSFIDKKIRDVAVHQNRLALLIEDKVSFSVSNQASDWWRGTTSQLLATSPIDIQSTSSAAGDLRSFVVHNNDLMVFGPYGQFRFSGRQALTPQNASLPQTSSYPNTLVARPQSAGNEVYFPTTYGESSGLSKFTLDKQVDNLSVASPMASRQIGLIPGDIMQIVAAPNLGLIMNRITTNRARMFIMEFEPTTDLAADAETTWASWEFAWGMRIISMRLTGAYVEFMAVGHGSNTGGDSETARLYRLPLHTVASEPSLDVLAISDAVTTSLTLTAEYPQYFPYGLNADRELTIVQGPGCPSPGTVVPYTVNGLVYTFADMSGGQVYYGYEYSSSVVLPPIITRDKAGIRMTDAKKRLDSLTLSVEGSCDVQVNALPLQSHAGGYGVDDVRFQAKAKSNDCTITVSSNGPDDMNLNQAEWTGKYYKAGRRF